MLFSGFLLRYLQNQFCCCQASQAFFTVRTFCGVGILLARECKTHHVAMKRCSTILQRCNRSLIIVSEWTGSRYPGFWNGPEFDDYSNHIFVTKTTLKAVFFKKWLFQECFKKIRISLLYYFWKIGPEIFTWFSDPEFLGQKIDYLFYIPSFCTLGTWFVFFLCISSFCSICLQQTKKTRNTTRLF